MGRGLKIAGSNTIDYATKADSSLKKEYFQDFVIAGARDQRVYGLTRITPSMNIEYDLNGLNLLRYVLGGTTVAAAGNIVVQSTIPEGTFGVVVESEYFNLMDAKIDTWELTVEEGNPVKANFNAIGKSYSVGSINGWTYTYTPDWSKSAVLPSDVLVNGSNTLCSRLNLKIDNKMDVIFKTNSLPVQLREAGLEVTGRIRAPNYSQFAPEGGLTIAISAVGTITLNNVKFTEVPPRVTGYDIPETELAFTCYPSNTGASAVSIDIAGANSLKW